ncbi:alpha/beta hydrolase [Corynebacterium pseudokroppenstedtii]|uniref:Alpha/beta hydrolase n=1 Tax=Corynebacterium pseudokroppenstedtii TaxID=2804917 RepID=A0AAU0PYY1_9CORY|nr:alpha/beta hydrolase [Corynebacterium pseudokroppenstedtii]MBY0790431.1 alpha/beta fold hydrolase [Corynebacterium pseudokroppenstedtii]MCF6793028.1 alpha/beta hydrolase [Corynebacterium pseudokroppenstedtii]MCF8702175.1 alpha/beta hydrolase [Corynebacterium pseudokroppenstedtii]MCG2635681.1 alpha/beta hydrolase [Corynebacterium pseudokroppenstedtii]
MTTHHNPLARFNRRQSPHRKPGIPGTTPSRTITTTIIAAALTLSASGLAQAGPYPHPTPQDSATPPTTSSDTTKPQENPAAHKAEWGPCPPGSMTVERAQCATITVPKDYNNPNVGTIELTMSKISAKGSKKGTIAGNIGGPGLDALAMFTDKAPQNKSAGHIQMPTDVLEHYDLVAVEPRGLTFGTPLECDEGLLESLVPGGGNLYRACQRTQPGYVDTITTENTARDLEEARKALGEDKLNLYGVSYGGLLMATYATLFPEHTNKMVLDSSMSPNDAWFGLGGSRISIRKEAINAFFDWIAHNDDKYHLGKTPREVYQSFTRVIKATYNATPPLTPPPANRDDVSAVPDDYADNAVKLLSAVDYAYWRSHTFTESFDLLKRFGAQQALSPLTEALYSQQSWPDTAAAIAESASTDPVRPLDEILVEKEKEHMPELARLEEMAKQNAEEADNPDADESDAEDETLKNLFMQSIQMGLVNQTIMCNENANPPARNEYIPALINQYTGGDQFVAVDQMIASGQQCDGWPNNKPIMKVNGDKLAVKPLSLGYDKDTAVTPHGAPEMRDAMGGSLHMFTGYSHGVLAGNAADAANVVSEYFRD